jgi:sigma-E factor negative regulatory protein RseA
MAQANKAENEQASTSEIYDGELILDDASLSQLDSEKFLRYAMIGDALRAKSDNAITIDITASVAAALADEPCHNVKGIEEGAHQPAQSNVVSISSWKKPFSQIAIAASVALVAVLGVNTMHQTPVVGDDLPVLQSIPVAGGVAPVSFSSEGSALQSAQQGVRELQQQRIGALVLEHQRQSRMAHALHQAKTEKLEDSKESN